MTKIKIIKYTIIFEIIAIIFSGFISMIMGEDFMLGVMYTSIFCIPIIFLINLILIIKILFEYKKTNLFYNKYLIFIVLSNILLIIWFLYVVSLLKMNVSSVFYLM